MINIDIPTAGTPYLKSKGESNLCYKVDNPFQFGVFCSIDPTTKQPDKVTEGRGIYISGWVDCKCGETTQHFWSKASSIYVRCDGSVVAGDVLYVLIGGTGVAVNNPTAAGSGYTAVGIAKSDAKNVNIDANGTTLPACKINFNYITAAIQQ